VGRLYEAVFAQRLLAVVLVGLAGALANQIANTICEMVGTHGRLHFFAMWQMYGMIFLVTAAVYAVATGVLAAVVALWKSRLSMPQAPPPPQSSPEPPAANTPSS
jgi:hypothetical protein